MPPSGSFPQISWKDFHLRYQNSESSSPLPDMVHLPHYLILQVPGEDEEVVRTGLAHFFRRQDRDLGSRKKASLLVRIPVHGVFDEIGPNPAVIQQRVPLRRGPVTCDGLPLSLQPNQEFEDFPLLLLDPGTVGPVKIQVFQPARLLPIPKGLFFFSLPLFFF